MGACSIDSEADGFVARKPDPDDRRAYFLVVTADALPIIECIYDLTRMIYTTFSSSSPKSTRHRAAKCHSAGVPNDQFQETRLNNERTGLLQRTS